MGSFPDFTMKTIPNIPALSVSALLWTLGLTDATAQSHRVLAHFPTLDGAAGVVQIDPARGVAYLGGNFTSVGGQPRSRLAAIDLASGAVLPWNPAPDNSVSDLLVADGVVFVAGAFVTIDGTMRRGIAAFDAATGALMPWNANSNHAVRRMERAGSRLFVSGQFTQIGGKSRAGLASLALANASADDWDPAPDDSVWALHSDGDAVYVGGEFTSIGGKSRQHAAMLHPVTGEATNWNPAPDAAIWAIRTYGDRVLLAGEFSMLGATPRKALGAVDKILGVALPWNPLVTTPAPGANYVVSLELVGSHLLFGGAFKSVGGSPRTHLADVNLETGAVRPLSPVPNETLYRVRCHGATVFAVGSFSQVDGFQKQGFVAIDYGSLRPTVRIAGTAVRRTRKSRVAVRGAAACTSGPLASVRLKVGPSSLKALPGKSVWKTTVRLKRGLNTIEARSHAKSGLVSLPSKIRVRRR